MEKYQIHDLEQLSGIKAHTIRIWEKRYNLLEPERSDTNIRYYSDAHIRKLLNVCTLLENGYKISKIAELDEDALKSLILGVKNDSGAENINLTFINELISYMLEFNEPAFEKIFSAAVTRFGMYKTITEIVYPFLQKTGVLWAAEEASPAQEHFASSIIRRKLMAASDGLPPATKTDKKFLLFLPNDEWHEIGLLFSDYIIRAHGYQSIYLGQNMPSKNVEMVIRKTKPTHLVCFFVAGRNEENAPFQLFSHLLKHHKYLKIRIGGNFSLTEIHKLHKNVGVLKTPDDLIKLL